MYLIMSEYWLLVLYSMIKLYLRMLKSTTHVSDLFFTCHTYILILQLLYCFEMQQIATLETLNLFF